jgi:hypothetical protein
MKEIKGVARVKFFPGKLEEWKRLTEQSMEIVRTPGILRNRGWTEAHPVRFSRPAVQDPRRPC